jgi:hypothetical protein
VGPIPPNQGRDWATRNTLKTMTTDIQFPMAHIVPSKGLATFEVHSKDTIHRVFIVKADSPERAKDKAKRFCSKYKHPFKSSCVLLCSSL